MKNNVKKVPVILQMEALECGAASLAMILAFHRKFLPLEQIRVDCGVSRDGSSAKNLLLAARRYGLEARGFRMEPENLKSIQLPAIIHWNHNHFVVLAGFKKNKVIINDPASGILEVTYEELDVAFTGIVLTFGKTEKFIPQGKPKSITGFIIRRMEKTIAPLVFIIITGVLLAFLNISTPLFVSIFIDNILFKKSPNWLVPILGAMGISVILTFVLTAIQSIYLLKIKAKMSITSGASFMWHIIRLPVEFYAQRFAGDIVERQNNNDDIASILCHEVVPAFLNVVMIGFYLLAMARYDLSMTFVGITIAILNIMIVRKFSKNRQNLARAVQRDFGRLSGITVSGIEIIETLKASGAETVFFEKWSGYQSKYNNTQVKLTKANQYIDAIPGFLQGIGNVLVLIMGVNRIMSGDFSVGMLIAFQGFFSAFITPVNEMMGLSQTIQNMQGQIESIEDVMNYKVDEECTSSCSSNSFNKLSGKINIHNLTFGYSILAEPIIKDFCLSIDKGASIALIGGSGSGKSTVTKVVSGLYKKWSGEILFDDILLESIQRDIFKSSVAVVDQEISLFEGTIRDNITMWDKTIPESVVIQAAKDACIHEDIMLRDKGYNHMVLEGGRNFSGGQKQRIEIARALVSEPTLLILDEATSALDPKTENSIMIAVKRREITCIIIAHRLSTIRDCDEILVLEKGIILERGTHEVLKEQNGKYAKLIAME